MFFYLSLYTMNIFQFIKKHRFIFTVIFIILIIIIFVFLPAGIVITILTFIYLYGQSKRLSMLRGKLVKYGPYPLEWFDNNCYINSINYMFSAIDEFPQDIRGKTDDKNYEHMIDKLIELHEYINRLNKNTNVNREYIELYKKVCNDSRSVFWKNAN